MTSPFHVNDVTKSDKMASRLSQRERIFTVKAFLETKSPVLVQRNFRKEFYPTPAPSKKHIYNLVGKFETCGSLFDNERAGRPKSSRSDENVTLVNSTFSESPQTSIRRAAAELDISKSSIQRMLTGDLELFPYKIQIMQALTITDQVGRLDFCNWATNELEKNENAFMNVWFSDECHFLLSGHVNKQNMRYWSTNQPHEFAELPLHSEKVTVWCAISGHGIIGPFFFSDTVNGERYLTLLRRKFVPALRRNNSIEDQYFMQDGAPPHTANDVLDYLEDVFGERVISRRYPDYKKVGRNWPAHSPDLNPCDYFLWGYLKSKVYQPKPLDVDMLKLNIRREIRKIDKSTCVKVINNFTVRVNEGKRSNGRHLENVIKY